MATELSCRIAEAVASSFLADRAGNDILDRFAGGTVPPGR